jgi:predicted outer membrane lipoprotein
MSQTVLIEALAQEIFEAIDRYGDSIPLAAAVGVLDCVKFQLVLDAREESEKTDD